MGRPRERDVQTDRRACSNVLRQDATKKPKAHTKLMLIRKTIFILTKYILISFPLCKLGVAKNVLKQIKEVMIVWNQLPGHKFLNVEKKNPDRSINQSIIQ